MGHGRSLPHSRLPVALQASEEGKDEMLRKGANKDKRKRPENLIIQEIDADMTNPAFVMRTAEAHKSHTLVLSSFMKEHITF